jgi:hypothetical protein
MSALIQNFAIPADNDLTVEIDITFVAADTLAGSVVFWNAYEEQYGVPVPGVAAVISKSSLSGMGDITLIDSPPTALVTINRGDTVALLRNFFHETTVVDSFGNVSTINCGILTISPSENRPPGT